MPEVQEVFRMATQKVRPAPGFVDRQYDHRRKQERKRKMGALAVAAAIGVAAVALILGTRAGGNPITPRDTASTGTGRSVTVPSAPDDYVIDLNTGVTTPLPKAIIRSLGKTAESGQYAATRDGSRLAYVGTGDEGSPQIFIAGIDGTGVRQMTHDQIGATSPAWSPDGTMIAYARGTSGRFTSLFVLDVATGVSTQITGESGVLDGLQFTPDGSSVVFTGGTDQQPMLRTVPVAGGKSTLLMGRVEGLARSGNGSLSPDGSLVTFSGMESGGPGPGRWLANADGTDRQLLRCHGSIPAGTWSPDGSRIVCQELPGRHLVVVVDIATGAAAYVAEGRAAIWLDDQRLLVEV